MANHLIIGLGGTGGKIIREFRKQYLQEYGDLKPHDGLFVEYLYLDSDVEKGLNGAGWRVFGEDISLNQSQKVNIQGESGLKSTVLQNFVQYPELASFLSQEDVDILSQSSLVDGKQAGQRRKIGRLLLARHINDEGRGFRKKLKSIYYDLTKKSGRENVHIHVVAGLAGGTGSGTIIDIITQIHSVLEHVKENNILTLYLYVPDLTHTGKSFEFYQANGYASLVELNAISTGDYAPIDISANNKRIKPEIPFNMAYLFTDTNDRKRTLDFDKTLPNMVASFLFYNLLSGNEINKALAEDEGIQQLDRLVTSENVESESEVSNDGENHKRSRRFLSFGFHKVEYPENEITEYLTYHHEEQAILAILNNEFTDEGFSALSGEVSATDLDTLVEKERHNLGLSEEALTLQTSSVIGEDSLKWGTFYEEWHRIISGVKADAEEDSDSSTWMDYFLNTVDEIKKKSFRGTGMTSFFNNKQLYLDGYAEKIVNSIESYLIERVFSSYDLGLVRAEKYLNFLGDMCIKWAQDFAEKQTNLLFKLKGEGNPNSLYLQLDEKEDEFSGMGSFRRAFNAHKSPFREFCDIYADIQSIETEIEGLGFAIKLLSKVRDRILDLSTTVHLLVAKLDEIKEMSLKEASRRCVVTEKNEDITTSKYFDTTAIRNLKNITIKNREKQDEFRKKILDIFKANSKKSFAYMLQNIGVIEDEIEKETTNHIKEIVSELTKDTTKAPILNVNILSLLKKELTNRDKMKKFASDLVESAACFVPFNNTQSGATITELYHLSLPNSENEGDSFRDDLIDAIKGSLENSTNFSLSTSQKENEIVFLSAKSGFPLRYIRNLQSLRKSYERLISDSKDGDKNRFYLHSEVREYPSLEDMDKSERQEKALPYIIAALSMGVIKKTVDPVTEGKIYVAEIEEDGLPMPKRIEGRDFVELLRSLSNNPNLTSEILNEVKKKLNGCKSDSMKSELRAKLSSYLKEEILPLYNGNMLSEGYQEAANALKELFNKHLKLSDQ